MKEVMFHREDCFYIIKVRDNEDLAKHAELNKGTIKITDMNLKTLWPPLKVVS